MIDHWPVDGHGVVGGQLFIGSYRTPAGVDPRTSARHTTGAARRSRSSRPARTRSVRIPHLPAGLCSRHGRTAQEAWTAATVQASVAGPGDRSASSMSGRRQEITARSDECARSLCNERGGQVAAVGPIAGLTFGVRRPGPCGQLRRFSGLAFRNRPSELLPDGSLAHCSSGIVVDSLTVRWQWVRVDLRTRIIAPRSASGRGVFVYVDPRTL